MCVLSPFGWAQVTLRERADKTLDAQVASLCEAGTPTRPNRRRGMRGSAQNAKSWRVLASFSCAKQPQVACAKRLLCPRDSHAPQSQVHSHRKRLQHRRQVFAKPCQGFAKSAKDFRSFLLARSPRLMRGCKGSSSRPQKSSHSKAVSPSPPSQLLQKSCRVFIFHFIHSW